MTEPQLLVEMDQYLKSGIHIGTKFKTKYMENFIYKIKPDGLVVMNLQKIDERLRVAADFISRFAPSEIVIISKRENGWKPLKLLSKVTGIKVMPGRYTPGTMTNLALDEFSEFKLLIVVDAWLDKNAVHDAKKAGMAIVGLCDTNNQSNNLDLIIPCNNKGRKALGLVFWILTNEYMHKRGMPSSQQIEYSIDDFSED